MKYLLLFPLLVLSFGSIAQRNGHYSRLDLTVPVSEEKVHVLYNGYLLIFDRNEFLGKEKNDPDMLALFNPYDTLVYNDYQDDPRCSARAIGWRIDRCLENGNAMIITPAQKRLTYILFDYRKSNHKGCFRFEDIRFLNPATREAFFEYSYRYGRGCGRVIVCPSF